MNSFVSEVWLSMSLRALMQLVAVGNASYRSEEKENRLLWHNWKKVMDQKRQGIRIRKAHWRMLMFKGSMTVNSRMNKSLIGWPYNYVSKGIIKC